MNTTRQFLLIAGLFCSLHRALVAAEATSVEVFVGRENTARSGASLTIPAGTDTLRFLVKPMSLFARYKLEGLDEDWSQQVDTIFLRLPFFNQQGDPLRMTPFPAGGRSAGWKGTIQDSSFTSRVEQLTVPPGAASVSLIMTTAGPASLVGIFAIKDVSVTSTVKPGVASNVLMSESRSLEGPKVVWTKSGTHPSMATRLQLGDPEDSSSVLVIMDDDINAHADWITNRIQIPPELAAGGTLEIRWQEAYSTGLGGNFTAIYERLPAGRYRFVVEDLTLTGESLKTGAAIEIIVPKVFWKSFGFWGATVLVVTLVSALIGRY